MPDPENLESRWVHPHAFESYEIARSAVAPALTLAIQQSLRYVPNNGEVFEIGAGGGAFRHYAGEGQTLDWTESDHNPVFLALPRTYPTKKVTACLPDIPIKPRSVDGVIGLGVLDTMATGAVDQTIVRAYRVLREGGVLLHVMDLSPDIIAEIHNAKPHGLFPLPYMKDEAVGLCYVERENVGAQLKSSGVKPSTTQVLLALIRDPYKYVPKTSGNAILPYLGNLAMQRGLAQQEQPNWMQHFGNRLGELASAHGFTVLANKFIEEEAYQLSSRLPGSFLGTDAISRRYGVLSAKNPPGKSVPLHVKAAANLHVFAAQKLSS